jgi:diguanylate cyclase (GGDEF)-like protein
MLVLTICAFAVVSVPAYFAFTTIVSETVLRLGALFAEKQILFDRYRGLGALMQEVKLAETLATSGAVREWAQDEFNEERRARGIAELEHFRATFADHSYFFVVGASGNYYFNDAANSYAGKQLSHTLDPDNPRDGWYFKTASLGEGCHLNVDHDDVLAVTKVWINCVIRDGERVLGVLGTGLDLTAFVKEVVDIPQTGVTAMFVDRAGAVQAHRDPAQVDFHSITKHVERRKTIFAMIDDEGDRAAMRRMLDEVTTDDVQVRSQFMRMGGREVLVGVGYLDRLDWYNVTVMDVDEIIDRSLFVPIGALLAGLMLVVTLSVSWLFRRIVLDRLARVEARISAVAEGRYAEGVVDTGQDEIGRMSQTFDAMAKAVESHTVELEQQVEARTAELRRLADRDQMTGIPNRRGFIAAFDAIRAAAPHKRMALLLIDIDDFKTINDSFGHFVGDQVVIEIAQRLDGLLRHADVCGRWGGDELILLVGDIRDHDVGAVAEAVRLALISRSIDIGDGRVVRPRLSIGACLVEAADSVAQAADKADSALYRAKASGRNRAVAYAPERGAWHKLSA